MGSNIRVESMEPDIRNFPTEAVKYYCNNTVELFDLREFYQR